MIALLGTRELTALLFVGLWLVYCLSWFTLPLGFIGRVCSVIVALPLALRLYFFSMLNSAEHEILHADKSQITNNCIFFLLNIHLYLHLHRYVGPS